jgi:hypothetical protein
VDNLDELAKIKLPDAALEFILAVPGRRYGEFVEVLASLQAKAGGGRRDHRRRAGTACVWWRRITPARQGRRCCGASACSAAGKANQWAGKLDAQTSASRHRAAAVDSGAKAPAGTTGRDAHLARIVKVDLKRAVQLHGGRAIAAQAELMDGKLLLVTNVADLTLVEVVHRYKALADIERGFRVLKSEIEIAPVYHRLPERIRAHAMLCFMALIVYRVMRQRLKLAKSDLSPEKALAQLRRIQRHRVSINQAAPISGISTINTQQAGVLAALNLKKPTEDTQLSLL